MEGPPFQLVEAAAAALCRAVLDREARVAAVRVAVSKPHVALPGTLSSVGVEVLRWRDGGGGEGGSGGSGAGAAAAAGAAGA